MKSNFETIVKNKTRGSMKLYLGYAAGVGKTYAMLQEAHRLKSHGIDVVVGYVEPHERDDTRKLSQGLELMPIIPARDGYPSEMNVPAILERAPTVVLVDELAHSRPPGPDGSVRKRWQDVIELLEANINVISTMNVQHLETLKERVERVTGVEIKETVPDSILDYCDELVNIDLSVSDLRDRIRQGKVYQMGQVDLALRNFFTSERLSSLRELALRETASDQDRKSRLTTKGAAGSPNADRDNVMACLPSLPGDVATLIRAGARIAIESGGDFYVVYVRAPDSEKEAGALDVERRINKNVELARSLEGIVTELKVPSRRQVANALVQFAHENNVRHAVFGKSRRHPVAEWFTRSVADDFIRDSIGVDVHITCTRENL